MARIVKEFHSFTYTPRRIFAIEDNHSFAFPAKAGHKFTVPGGMEGWVDLLAGYMSIVYESEDGHIFKHMYTT